MRWLSPAHVASGRGLFDQSSGRATASLILVLTTKVSGGLAATFGLAHGRNKALALIGQPIGKLAQILLQFCFRGSLYGIIDANQASIRVLGNRLQLAGPLPILGISTLG